MLVVQLAQADRLVKVRRSVRSVEGCWGGLVEALARQRYWLCRREPWPGVATRYTPQTLRCCIGEGT